LFENNYDSERRISLHPCSNQQLDTTTSGWSTPPAPCQSPSLLSWQSIGTHKLECTCKLEVCTCGYNYYSSYPSPIVLWTPGDPFTSTLSHQIPEIGGALSSPTIKVSECELVLKKLHSTNNYTWLPLSKKKPFIQRRVHQYHNIIGTISKLWEITLNLLSSRTSCGNQKPSSHTQYL